MLLKTYPLIIACFLHWISFSNAHARTLHHLKPDPAEIDALLHQFCDLKNPLAHCEKSPVPREPEWKTFFSTQKCSILLTDHPPEWVKQSAQKGVFGTPGNWIPVCSVYQLENYRQIDPSQSRDQRLHSTSEYTKSLDLCTLPASDSFNANYHEPSQKEAGVKLLSPLQKENLLHHSQGLRDLAIQNCCEKEDSQCQELMKAVAIKFCVPQKNRLWSEPCIGTGTYYLNHFDDHWTKLSQSNQAVNQELIEEAKGKFDLQPGSITLSPFVSNFPESDLVHEFGHACSQIRRNLAVNRGDAASLSEFLKSEACDIDKSTELVYEKLFKLQSLNEASTRCLVDRAKQATRARYLNRKCSEGCPRASLEEGFAEVFRLLTVPEKTWVPDKIPMLFCNSERDAHHLLTSDVLACLVKSPSVLKSLERATGCQNK